MVPFLTFFLCSVIGAFLAQRHVGSLIEASMRQLGQESKGYLVNVQQDIIRVSLREVAEQLNLIIKSHPGITIEQLQRSPVVRRLAVQASRACRVNTRLVRGRYGRYADSSKPRAQ